jgi:bacterioferritin-associated ferredoxin
MSTLSLQAKTIVAELKGRDRIEVTVEAGKPDQWKVIGCHEVLQIIKDNRSQHGELSKWPMPTGNSHSEILVRELLQKSKDAWQLPYLHEELCHCRGVPTDVVDQAIIAGAHAPKVVSRWTTASTACGTCRPDVEKLLAYRLR